MNAARTARIAALVLAFPLALGACRDEQGGAPQTTETQADTTATTGATATPADTHSAEPRAASPVSQAEPPRAPPPVCADCGTVTDVRSYEVKGQASGVGAAVGAVTGGLLGHQIGGGSGKKIATVAGAVGGGLAGHEIEKRRNTETRWEVTVQMDDGTTATLPYAQAPGLSVGQKVRVVDGQAMPR